jgi:hypothetical protein
MAAKKKSSRLTASVTLIKVFGIIFNVAVG